MDNNNQGLGRGLSSLISKNSAGSQPISGSLKTPYFPKQTAGQNSQIVSVDPTKIKINPHQPRKEFKERELKELAESISQYGIIQPLLVTNILGGGYELVAGERRLRASKMVGLKKVPVIVRSAKELEKLELSLIENIQRHDLNPLEKAAAYKKLVDDFNLTHEEGAKRLGVSRAQFSNTLRLLNLPEEIKQGILSGRVSFSQAKLMLEVRDESKQKQIYKRALQTGRTVEETKKEVKKVKVKTYERISRHKNPLFAELEGRMRESLGTKVKIRERGVEGGIIEIEFYSEEELESLVSKIS